MSAHETRSPAVEADDYRRALSRFASGVTVVTARMPDGRPVGVTATAFTAVSLDPPLVLVCLAETTSDLKAFTQGEHLAVNILGEDQKHLSLAFAQRCADKFAGVAYETWETGCPILAGCIANIECSRTGVYEGGDHLVILGRVERVRCAEPAHPLLHFLGGYHRIGKYL